MNPANELLNGPDMKKVKKHIAAAIGRRVAEDNTAVHVGALPVYEYEEFVEKAIAQVLATSRIHLLDELPSYRVVELVGYAATMAYSHYFAELNNR